MRKTLFWAVVFMANTPCHAQEFTLTDAKRELTAARAEVKKVVTFCPYCKTAGTIEGEVCIHCKGQGVILKSEQKLISHKAYLQNRAEQAGLPRDKYAEFDIAKRLEKFEQDIEPEAFKMLAAYVGYVKTYRKNRQLIKEDEKFARKAERVIEQLDALIERHGRRLRIPSMRLLYEDEPAGKVGAFNLYGKKGQLQIDGKDVEWLEMRTLKEYSILVVTGEAKKRAGFIVAEIIGKQTYRTEGGKKIKGILMQAY
ncbi:MAG: hypothetical protein ACE5I3_12025 [Phycisphaerae bacterium]